MKKENSIPSSTRKPTVVYASDGSNLDFLNASIFTLKKNAGIDVDIYVLSDYLLPREVPEAVKIIDPTPILSSLGFHSRRWGRRWPYATLFRMAIPLLEDFKDLDRVLYLDIDVLVEKPSLEALFTMDLYDFEIFAAKDSRGTGARIDKCIRGDLNPEASRQVVEKIWRHKHVTSQVYANAGVAIWCVKNILDNGIEWYKQRLKWFWEAELRGKFDYLDQDFINSMMNTSPTLSQRYNCHADRPMVPEDQVIIRHYVAHTKNNILERAERLGYDTSTAKKFDEPAVVVYASDGRDADRLRMSAMSARMFLGSDVKFYILTEASSYPALKEATLVNPVEALRSIGIVKDGWNRKWPFSCLFRLAIPLLDEFKDYNRVLYLDTDTLVRSPTINYLFRMKSSGYEIFGAQDIENRQLDIERIIRYELSGPAKRGLKDKLWRKREKITQGYINSGVVLEFLSEVRNNGIEWYKQRLKWFWEGMCQGNFHFPDQDFINIMMDVSPSLSVRFNRFGGDFSINCVIQHFVGGTKRAMRGTAEKLGLAV